ncbi:MAG TPA: hypothetical protein VFB74_25080 [Kribbellaceae bacterium]|nr:hypothetical protein [Kribbellaceae bacterium]
MHAVQTTPSPTIRISAPRTFWRWMATVTGFPLGGYAAYLITGHVDSLRPALLAGLITGAILGAVQVWGLGRNRPPATSWITATAVGMMLGLGLGSAVVDYHTSLADLVTQGAITGLVVGITQGLVLRRRLGRLALAWPAFLAVIWAGGWAVTTTAGIDVDLQFPIFGSSGALMVTALTLVLPYALNRERNQS